MPFFGGDASRSLATYATRAALDQVRRQTPRAGILGPRILVGQCTTFSAISYAVGVPACLPTGQFARAYSGVTVDTYLRFGAVAALDTKGIGTLAPVITALATHEGFPAHVRSIELRREKGLLS